MATSDFIQRAYIAFFNRPADKAGFDFWLGTDLPDQALLNQFAASEEYFSDYAGKGNRETIRIIYQNLFGRKPDSEGWDYWEAQMNEGWVTVGNAAYEILGGAQGTDLAIVNNKAMAAQAFTDALVTPELIAAYANPSSHFLVQAFWLGYVGSADSTLDAALSNLDNTLDRITDPSHYTKPITERIIYLVGSDPASNETFIPHPLVERIDYPIDRDPTSNTTLTLSTDPKVMEGICWDGTFDNSKLTVLNFDCYSNRLDFHLYGVYDWVGAATLDGNGHAIGISYNDWQGDSGDLPIFPRGGYYGNWCLRDGDKYLTFIRESTLTTTYKIELWTVRGDYADAYYGLDLPLTEDRDEAQLIGHVDLGYEIGQSVMSVTSIWIYPANG